MPTRMHLPTHDRTLAREVCAAAMFGGVDLMDWLTDAATLVEDYDMPLHRAARMANVDRGITSDEGVVTPEQRAALRTALDAAIVGAIGARSGLADRDAEAVLAIPRERYDGADKRLCRDLVAILWPAWQRADRAAVEAARCG